MLLPERRRVRADRASRRCSDHEAFLAARPARSAASPAGARRTRWTRSSTRRWYFLRYCSPHDEAAGVGPGAGARWMPMRPVHRRRRARGACTCSTPVLHEGAARHAAMLSFDEPIMRLRNQGQILGADHQRMSKSRGNVVSPRRAASAATAPTPSARFLMFIGPGTRAGRGTRAGSRGCIGSSARVWDVAPPSAGRVPAVRRA